MICLCLHLCHLRNLRTGFYVFIFAVFLAACARPVTAPPVLELTDAVIDSEVVWSGEVRITGVVTVKKTGRLTILPGTRIVFIPLDRDGDGTGDGELLIEGALVARGTQEAPIVFTSGAAQPKKADWKFLYLDFAREAIVERVVSEYAYSGIQIHFCKARILDSVFRHNVDGIRFSTVNLEAAGNLVHDNTHGIRYEERRGTAHLHHNVVRNNDIGIFVVTRAEDRTRIEYNDIVGSRQYQVKMGLEQPADVTFPRNWWGSADPQTIAAGFFDKRFDPALGRVHAPEPLATPVALKNFPSPRGEGIFKLRGKNG